MATMNRLAVLCAGTLALAAASAQAADEGFYVGVGTGQAQIKDNPSELGGARFDESSTPGRIFGGYRLGAIPLLDFAGEIGYRDLGDAEGTVNGTSARYTIKGPDASVLAIFPLLGFDIFGKVGIMHYDLDKTFAGATTGHTGTAPIYGVGVGFRFWRLGVRAEYERIDLDKVDTVDVGMVSVYFRF
ncbi:MAG: outer membrane beta-barrel protein [Burkholderiales bacterium]|nr:outer membrane beta-barrel protein [Burkholderiales bacterium]